jgi:hypothetical protein
MTLIAVYNSNGLVGRCDAKCYNATHPDCDCVCGGRNHGAGQQQAIDNTREMVREWIKKANDEGLKAVSEFEAPLFSGLALQGGGK